MAENHSTLVQDGYYERLGYEDFCSFEKYRERMADPSEATDSQISMILGLIKGYRFSNGRHIRNIVEIGVNNGFTDLYILKELEKLKMDARLFAIEKLRREDNPFFGYCVYDNVNAQEMQRYVPCFGKTAFDVEEILGNESEKVDLLFIDGNHSHPFATLDLLFFLPYLHKESIVLLHDVYSYELYGELGGTYLFTGWKNEKYLNYCVEKGRPFVHEYMGWIKLHDTKEENLKNLIDVAAVPIQAPFFNYTGSSNLEPIKFDLKEEDRVRIKEYVLSKFEQPLANEFIATLDASIDEYHKKFPYEYHKTRLYYNVLDKINAVIGRMEYLQVKNGILSLALGKQSSDEKYRLVIYGGAMSAIR